MIYVSIALFIAAWVLLYFMRRDTIRRGESEAKKEMNDELMHDIHLVKSARDRRDADKLLRDKYTRK